MVSNTFNPSAGEAEARESPELEDSLVYVSKFQNSQDCIIQKRGGG